MNRASTIDGKMSCSRIFTARQSSEMGLLGAALISWFPCLQDWDDDGALPDCQDIFSSDSRG